MLGLWVALLGLAASERLHHALCEDAGQLHHQCPVVTLASGQLLGAAAFVSVVVAAVSLVVRFFPFVSTLCARLDVSLTPGRGPPAVVVLQ